MAHITEKLFTFEEVVALVKAERDRAVKIAYLFKEENDEKYKWKSNAGSKVAFVSREVADECRLVGNAISGLTALSGSDTTETMVRKDLMELHN